MGEEVSGAGTFEQRGGVAGGPGVLRWLSRGEVGRGGLLRAAAGGGQSAAAAFSMVSLVPGSESRSAPPERSDGAPVMWVGRGVGPRWGAYFGEKLLTLAEGGALCSAFPCV